MLRFLGPAVVGALAAAVTASSYADTQVFINEIHYDNAGADTGELIEVAGPAGTDLTGWNLVLYNGSVGTAYDDRALPASIPDLGNGFGAVGVFISGIQNGSPDGVALVRGDGAVVQFLSYEGTFTAVDGLAAGETSTDIGVSESSSTAIGLSLQLTGNGSTYETFTWSGPATATAGAANQGQTFVGGGPDTTPPAIARSAPAHGAIDVATDIGIVVVDFTEDLDLNSSSNAGIDIACPSGSGSVAAGTAFDDPDTLTVTLNGPLPESTVCDLVIPADALVDQADNANTDPLTLSFTTIAAVAGCGDPGATPIWQIQGSGALSPLVGRELTIEAVVVGDFQPTDGTGLRGFFVQEEDADADADPATSDGIFIYDNGFGVDVELGDLVRVTGTVSEYAGSSDPSGNKLTELGRIGDVQVCSSGNAVTPASVALPLKNDPATDLEPTEGMAVDIVATDGDLVLAEYFNLDRYGEIRVAAGGRPEQFTASHAPNAAGYAEHLADMDRRTLLIDDGRTGQNLEPIPFGRGGNPLDLLVDPPNLLRGGDTVGVIEGVMHYDFGLYRVEPVVAPEFVAGNARPATAPAVDGSLRVVGYNVLNYFQQLDDGSAKCGPPSSVQTCRGADDGPVDSLGRNERDRQEEKLISALLAIDADIYGLVELENDFGNGGTTSAARLANLMDLTNAGESITACSDYVAVEPGVYVGTDAIAVGLIYCADSVEPAPGTTVEILDDSDLPGLGLGDLSPLFNGVATNRAALAASFRELASGEMLTVSVNHFKSKGASGLDVICDADAGLDPNCDRGDGAGYWNRRRTDAANALSTWLATDPTGAGDPDLLVLGDLNAYAKEDPIAALEAAGFENLIARLGVGAYSYLFDAQLGYLDYALANASLSMQVTDIAEWHINADEPDALDYDISFNPEIWYQADAFRTSDHDPVIVGLDLTPPVILGDLDGDADVDRYDFRILSRALGSREGGWRWNPEADFNGDGRVTLRDLPIWLGYFRDFIASEPTGSWRR